MAMFWVDDDAKFLSSDSLSQLVVIDDVLPVRHEISRLFGREVAVFDSLDALDSVSKEEKEKVGLVVVDLATPHINPDPVSIVQAFDGFDPRVHFVFVTSHVSSRFAKPERVGNHPLTFIERPDLSREDFQSFLENSLAGIFSLQESMEIGPQPIVGIEESATSVTDLPATDLPAAGTQLGWNEEHAPSEAGEGVLRITRLSPATPALVSLLRTDISRIYGLTPEEFELFVCDRLDSMGMELKRTGHVYTPDGGVDIVAWPRYSKLPFLLAVQVKHHSRASIKTGPEDVKNLQAVVQSLPFHGGLLVTNTEFTPTAIWWAQKSPSRVRLRDLTDLRRWLNNSYEDEEWREVPKFLELGPNLRIKLH